MIGSVLLFCHQQSPLHVEVPCEERYAGSDDAARGADNGMVLALRIRLPRRNRRFLLRTCPTTIPQQGGRGRCFGQSTILRHISRPQTLIDMYETPVETRHGTSLQSPKPGVDLSRSRPVFFILDYFVILRG